MGRRSPFRPATPAAYAEAEARNLAIAQRRRELEGCITAELTADQLAGGLRWYALKVTPGHERIAAAHLAGRRFGIYVPSIDTMVQGRGTWRFQRQPILPGYVFVSSLGLEGRWRRAAAVPGAIRFLTLAGTDTPAALPHRFIEVVRAYEEEENARFEVIHGRTPGASYALRKRRSRKARRSFRIRKAHQAARDRSP